MKQKHPNHIKESLAYRIFTVCNTGFILLYMAICLIPFINMLALSLSSVAAANANKVTLLPVDFTLEAYKEAFSDSQILSSLKMSAIRVAMGVTIQMIFTILAAYPMSRENKAFPGRRIYVVLIVFTMLFSGGFVPTYMLIVNQLKLANTVWALVLPNAVPVFNLIILMNFFRQIPKEIEEAAIVDGAGHVTLLTRIYLPLSMNALLTLVLFACVGHWNAWFDGEIYMRDPINYPISTYLRVTSNRIQNVSTMEDARMLMRISPRTMIMTYTIICTLPIVCVYPFLQRYVKSGLVLGSVKG